MNANERGCRCAFIRVYSRLFPLDPHVERQLPDDSIELLPGGLGLLLQLPGFLSERLEAALLRIELLRVALKERPFLDAALESLHVLAPALLIVENFL